MINPVGIELFAGCGGLSTGFLDAGLLVKGGFEIDARAVQAYDYNHSYRGSRGHRLDLSVASGLELLRLAGIEKVDFLIGGPPCQPFSVAGKRRGMQDTRAELIGHFIRLVGELRPSAFVLENVPNLSVIDDGALLEAVVASLRNLGYSTEAKVLSAAEYGVAQNRRRLIVLGFAGNTAVRFPDGNHGQGLKTFRTARDAIGDLPDAGEYGETGIHNHEPTAHSVDMVDRFRKLLPGKRERGSFHDRLHPDRPSFTLRAGSGNFSPLRPVHYHYDRVITVRESARIQGFSDDFIWPDSIPRLQQYRQVGNAVPPPLGSAIAEMVANTVGWKLDAEQYLGDPTIRPRAISMTDEQRKALRSSRTRGASLGRAALASRAA